MTKNFYQIVLRAERHPDAPEVRLRALLKRAWRDGALRCVEILQLDSPEEDGMKMSKSVRVPLSGGRRC
jgi:hypothetical protein